MPIVQAKCTNCGANLEVDNAKEAAVCQYCDSAFIVEKAINNYTNYITNEYRAQVINVYGTDEAFETDGHKLIAYKGNSRDVYIPVHITEIGDDAFRGNINIEHVFLHDGIRIIGNYAFGLCSNLKQVVLSKNLWLVGHHAFAGCTSLNAIELPDSITTIKHFAFDSCESLEEIVLPQKLTVIQCRSFCNCKNLRKVTIPNSVTKIETEVFVHCDNLKELVIPASVTHLDGFVFMQCNLDRLVFEDADRVTHITSALFLLNNKVPEIVATNSFKARYGQYLATQDAELSKTLNSLSGNSSTNSGCYVATAVYGSYDCPQVWTLRRFRDYKLASTWYGRMFIRTYYAVSPTLVRWFGHTKWFKNFWKVRLDKMVSNLQKIGVESTPYQDKMW